MKRRSMWWALGVVLLVAWSAPGQAAPPYVLGPGDVIDVTVLGEPTLSMTLTVQPDGRISYPMLGEMTAAGLTPDDLARKVAWGLRQYIRMPRVTVIVRDARARPYVYLLGQVAHPGAYEIQRGWTVVQAVASAGGVTPGADLQKATLIRQGGQDTIPVDLEHVLVGGDAHAAPALEGGDVIVIPQAPSQHVYVLGLVTRPGSYDIPPGSRLHEALSLAGGPDRRAALEAVGVVRQDPLQRARVQTYDLSRFFRSGDASQDPVLRPGDVVYVPETRTPDWGHVLEFLGILVGIVHF